jgi:hypothetical protein
MTQMLGEWTQVENQCIRAGWILGWAVSITVAAVGFAAGSYADLTIIRALLALLGFVLLGWGTGRFVSRLAPNEGMVTLPTVGRNIDLRVGENEPARGGSSARESLARSGDAA